LSKKTSSLMKAIDIILDSIEFITLNFLLFSGMQSFRTSVVHILLFAVAGAVSQKFLLSLKRCFN